MTTAELSRTCPEPAWTAGTNPTAVDLEMSLRRVMARSYLRLSEIDVTTAAMRLGVTREHLSRVLHGHRESRDLLRRVMELTPTTI